MKKLTIFFLPAIIIFSCNKKDSIAECTKSAASISGSYKMTALTYKANTSSAEQDILYLYAPEPCDRDDIYTFQTNGTYQLKDAGIVCTPSNDDNGTWSVAGNSMIMDGDSYVIENYDCKALVLSQTDVQTNEKIKATFTRQ